MVISGTLFFPHNLSFDYLHTLIFYPLQKWIFATGIREINEVPEITDISRENITGRLLQTQYKTDLLNISVYLKLSEKLRLTILNNT